jgi:hypothetical protein
MKINMMDATNIMAEIRKQIGEKRQKRNELSTYKTKELTKIQKTEDVNRLTQELNILSDHLMRLSVLMSQANLKYKIKLEHESMSLAEALVCVKELRAEVSCLQTLADLSERPKLQTNYGETYYEGATFDVKFYGELAGSLAKRAVSISRAIDRANEKAYFEFEPAENYLNF